MNNIHQNLSWRGLVHQQTDEAIDKWLLECPRTLYAGFDPTADSLHVGHLVPLMNLRRFQQAGHRPIVLVGGATGMIGDPSGKSEERQLLSADQIERNVAGMKRQMERFIDFGAGSRDAILVNNYDWMGEFRFLDFLRDVGKCFPIGVMLAKDSVKGRLARDGVGLSYTEFSYMLLQAYDFVHLYRTYNCELQIGASDQWGNITAGIDLARRLASVQLYGMTCPLLTKSDGTKMGKTESGALWLDATRTSPYQFYQYWINVDDASVEMPLKFFTSLGERETNELLTAHRADGSRRLAQKQLATDLTRLVHNDDGLAAAERATDIFFGGSVTGLTDAQLSMIFADVPSCTMSRSALDAGITLIDALVAAKLAPSKSEARRAIQQGGVYVNNIAATEIDRTLTANDLASESNIVLRSGKKRYAVVRVVR
ncbi:MAG: tyrosine--tRNA ligase [Thermoguttaceae bacterium]